MLLICIAIHQKEGRRHITELDGDIQRVHERVYKIGLQGLVSFNHLWVSGLSIMVSCFLFPLVAHLG